MSSQHPHNRLPPHTRSLGYPTRFNALPGIGESGDFGTNSFSRDLVPYGDFGANATAGMDSHRGLETEREVVRAMETRLDVTEKSNRALLSEVIRLQNEVKSVARKQDDSMREERKIQAYMESTLRTSRDVLTQLNQRLAEAEAKLDAEQRTVDSLVQEAKGIESMFRSYNRSAEDKKLAGNDRVNALAREIEDVTKSRNQLERIAFQLVDEIKMLKSQLEAQGFDITTVNEEMQQKSKRLADEYIHNLETLRRQIDRHNNEEQLNHQKFSSFESKLKDLRESISDLQQQQQDTFGTVRKSEDSLYRRINEINKQFLDLSRKQEELVRQLDSNLREKERRTDSERIDLENKIRSIVDEVNGKMYQRELKLNDEQIRKFSEMDKIIRMEQETRERHEREMKFEFERRTEQSRKVLEEEISQLRDLLKNDKGNASDTVRRLDEAIGLTEKQMAEMKKEVWNVLTAEIQTRSSHDENYAARLRDVEAKISAATAAMQQAIGGVAQNINSQSDSLSKTIRTIERTVEDNRRDFVRNLSDLETQVSNLQKRIQTADDRLEGRLNKTPEALSAMSSHVRDKIDSLSLWQSSMNSTVEALKRQQQSSSDDPDLRFQVQGLSEKLELLQAEVRSRVSKETDARLTEADALRRDIEELKRHPFDKFALKSDVEQCQSSVRKLAESMQTVKTILGMKIQSEQKLRVEEIKKLQDEVISLRQLIEPLLHRNQLPRVFIKPEGHEMEPRDVIEMAAPEINKWSMYSAYRWLHWKSKIMYIKWSLSNRKSAPKNPPEAADKTPEEAKKGPTPPPDHPWDEDEDGKEKPQ